MDRRLRVGEAPMSIVRDLGVPNRYVYDHRWGLGLRKEGA